MIEAEEAFYDNEENMDLQEDMVVYFVNWILEKCQEELKELEIPYITNTGCRGGSAVACAILNALIKLANNYE